MVRSRVAALGMNPGHQATVSIASDLFNGSWTRGLLYGVRGWGNTIVWTSIKIKINFLLFLFR